MKDVVERTIQFDLYGDLLTQKQREVFDFYYFQDFTLMEIAENLNISKQSVSDMLKRIDKKLKEFEEVIGNPRDISREELLGVYHRLQEVMNIDSIDQMRDALRGITQYIETIVQV